MKKWMLAIAVALFAVTGLGLAQEYDLDGQVIEVGSDTTYPPFETINEDG